MTKSHGTGSPPWIFGKLGDGTTIEEQVLIFHPENVYIGNEVYIGHQAILKGYYKNKMVVGDGSWIGQQCFLHSAGGLVIGKNVGVGPGVHVITSMHDIDGDHTDLPIMHRPLRFAEVEIGDGSDIGSRSVILPGVKLGKFVQVGAGAVVTKSFPERSVIAGVPARLVRAL